MKDLQVDESPKERRLIEERSRLRAQLRNEYVKQWTNPYRHAALDGGYIFDPSLQRWQSLRAQQYHYFKPTPKTLIAPFAVLSMVVGYAYLLYWSRSKKEQSFRTGQVSYRDRQFKFR